MFIKVLFMYAESDYSNDEAGFFLIILVFRHLLPAVSLWPHTSRITAADNQPMN